MCLTTSLKVYLFVEIKYHNTEKCNLRTYMMCLYNKDPCAKQSFHPNLNKYRPSFEEQKLMADIPPGKYDTIYIANETN